MAPSKKGKAGGPGKKGKKFVEDKSALLSLMDNLPKIQKESARDAALVETLSGKGKSSSSAADDEEMDVTYSDVEETDETDIQRAKARFAKEEAKKISKNTQRTKLKNRALLDTKRAILAQTKEAKKQRKDAKKPGSKTNGSASTASDTKPKRRVGFAV
ncbi:hypothetical protein QFC21_006886 [Naganishia friedmannii]|uniref:Uncharacterized protein n=1 Tax=Naganishia friedmannii TaxID=89922 RepID=A0ACC2V068_9TREE|nr:hypothetical protein QFC21_006886 [Naganishia friedmannii]